MRNIKILIIPFLLLLDGCISQFVPQTTEDKQMLVVEGLLTDKRDECFVKLSRSLPLGLRSEASPVTECNVTITDSNGQTYYFTQQSAGYYVPDNNFNGGVSGLLYTLHIEAANNGLSYESIPMELKPVPPIDSIYYEKVLIEDGPNGIPVKQGCNIFLDTHDSQNKCKFYRWDFMETWEFHLPYTVPNSICWLSQSSDLINIKNMSILGENNVKKFKINYVSNESDRLSQKYSMLIKQYSMTEDEFLYWDRLQKIAEQVGGLYDMIPASIPSNVFCLNDQNEKVLGYFSVSASTSKRVFIRDNFAGIGTPYTNQVCIADTVWGNLEIPHLGSFVWVIIDHPLPPPSYRVTTRVKGCYDCTLRGTNIKPAFWQ